MLLYYYRNIIYYSMKFYRKILIVVIFILFLYLFLRLFHKTGVLSEGFDIQEAKEEADAKVKNLPNSKIQSIANINQQTTPTTVLLDSTSAPSFLLDSTSAPSFLLGSTTQFATTSKLTSTTQPSTTITRPSTTITRVKENFYSPPDNTDNSWMLPKSSMPLNQYCVKSSYNTAISGDYTSEEMVSHVLTKGCRFIDFEVFYDKKTDAPFVAYTTDPSYTTINTKNKILLDTILLRSVRDAFTKAPNVLDPLLIQLRIKSNDINAYRSIAKSVNYALSEKLYDKKITENTTLDDIMGKVVLIVDKTLNLSWKQNSACVSDPNCYDLSAFCNIESGSELMRIERYDELVKQKTVPPRVMDDDMNTDVRVIRVVEPDLTTIANNKVIKNPIFKDYVMNYGTQIITYNYNNQDQNLNDHENFFNDIGFAFVPISSALQYFKQ